MATFIEGFLPAFAANVAAMMISVAGSATRKKLGASEVQKAIEQCVSDGITALLAKSADPSPENEHILTDCFRDYFGTRAVARELSKMLRGKEPDAEELVILFEDEAGYDRDNLPGLDFDQGIQAFIAAFMESAILEPALNKIIQAGQLIKQTRIQKELLNEMRRLVAFLRDDEHRVVGIQAGQIEAENVVSGIQVIHKVSALPPPPDNTEEQHYLKTLIDRCDVLELAAIDETCTPDDAIRISDVFTSLNLTKQRNSDQSVEDALTGKKEALSGRESSGEAVPIQAVEAVGNLSRLVILGQPGSGKSTLVNYITTRLALRRLPDTEISAELPGFEDDESPLPVRIILRHFAAWIPADTATGNAGLVWRYMEFMLDERWGCKCYNNLRQILQNQGGVIFFDGLDEVREEDEDAKRSVITEAVREFAGPLDKCRVVVTCREYAYKKTDAWRLPEKAFPVSELALFNAEQIGVFTRTWYQVMGPQKDWDENKQEAEANSLYHAIDTRPHLKEIAQYPLLLTLMAQVHGRDGYLPKDRADLYERAVNLLLEHWDNRIMRDTDGTCRRESGLILRLGTHRDTLRSVLEKVAFSAHEHQEKEKGRDDQCADISKLDLLEAFRDELGSLDKSENVIEYIRERAGLLIAQDNRTYTFPHRTFQEYLAAAYIMKQGELETMLVKRVRRDLNWWREVFLLAAGYSKSVPRNVSNIVDVLLPDIPPDNRVAPEQAKYARLAAQALVETDFFTCVEKERKEIEDGRFSRIFERIQHWLTESLKSDETLKATERAESGRILGQLDDPRKEVMTLAHTEFCLVPGGPFYMGSDDGGDDEKPFHLNECLNYDFWISRHPVTNAQYMEFVKAGGYAQGQYWQEAEEAGYWKSGKFKGRLDSEPRGNPYNFGSPFNLPNHPVVGVSWYESLAFTRWLTDFWQDQGVINENQRICLPSEAEWEKAARGGQEIPESPIIVGASQKGWENVAECAANPDSDRTYPWGYEADREKANYNKTGIGTTSAAGCFSAGAGPYGCLDMAGNVWEWTRTLYEDEKRVTYKYPYKPDDGRENEIAKKDISRVLRGGSCGYDSVGMRCAIRDGLNPVGRSGSRGFRVLCAPNSSGL